MDGNRFENPRIDALRVPPHSIDAEQAVLGGLMLDERAFTKIEGWLVEEDFYRKDHRLIFRAIRELASKQQPCDAVTLAEWLEANGLADLVGGTGYALNLANTTPSAANIVAYAEIVAERSRRRKAIDVGTEIASQAFLPSGPETSQIVAEAMRKLAQLQTSKLRGGLRAAKALLKEWFADLHRRYERNDAVVGMPTPWKNLDDLTHGLQDSELIILAGRPNMGKSVAAYQLASHIARAGGHVAVFSLEASEQSVIRRCVSALSNVPHDWLLAPTTKDEDPDYWPRISAAMLALSEAHLHIDEEEALDVEQICARAKSMHLKQKLRLVVVDHLHIVRRPGRNEVSELGHITSSLKALAKALGCPVLALAQLNRSLEQRPDKRPIMADLRASGNLEQDADVILFIYRDDYYDAKSHLKGIVEIGLGKGRDVRTGSRAYLANEFECMRMLDWVGAIPEPPARGEKHGDGFKRKKSSSKPRVDIDD